MVAGSPRQKVRPCLKSKSKRTGYMAQMVEHLPMKHSTKFKSPVPKTERIAMLKML
jgi:hypothetical protein